MIISINIKDVATYNTIDGVLLDNLKKVNFFFGYNGSGKSTIARYLKNISLNPSEQNSSFNQCSNVGYDSSQYCILVFDEEFIEENFRRSDDFKGIFSLNQSNAEIDKKIKDEEAAILAHKTLSDKYSNRIKIIDEDRKTKGDLLLNYCWSQRATFEAFTKVTLNHSGSKPNHLQAIRSILYNPLERVLPIEELTERYRELYEKDLNEITEKVDARTYLEIRRIEARLEKLLQEVILGNEDVDIAALIQKLNSRNWVEQGIRFLPLTDNICPFCQKKTIDEDLKHQFDEFFDETYKRKVLELVTLKEQYQMKTNSFVTKISAIQNVYNPSNSVSNLIIALKTLFDENIDTICNKIERANEKKSIVSLLTKKTDLQKIICGINANNQLFKDLNANRKSLIDEIWKYMAESCQEEIQKYDNRGIKYSRIISLANELQNKYIDKISTANRSIELLRSQTVNTKDAVDNINFILKSSGFDGFEIDEKSKENNISRYYLKRRNSASIDPVFDSLSEGEKNFISFLYFYQLCLGTDDIQSSRTKRKILVIDDPVSSLDSQALFIVSTLIHKLIQRAGNENKASRMILKNTNIAQVFILTHNLYFYKEVSFEKRPLCTDHWHFHITKHENQTSIKGDYNRQASDDYSLMWQTVKELKSKISTTNTYNVLIANSMRRIIESYVNFIGYGRDSWAALLDQEENDPHYYIKAAFISIINEENHKVAALDSIYYQKIINEHPQALFDAFAAIFTTIGKEHYEMMMEEQLPS